MRLIILILAASITADGQFRITVQLLAVAVR